MLPNHLPEQFFEIMEIISLKPVFKYDTNTAYICEDILYNTSHPIKNAISKEVVGLTALSLRTSFLETISQSVLTQIEPKIFIKRPSDSFRPLLNQESLERVLLAQGFVLIRPEQITFRDQVRFFSSASHIVMESGAAMTSMIFCKPRTRILELQPGDGEGGFWQSFCEVLNLQHFQITGSPKQFKGGKLRNLGYEINLETFTHVLDDFQRI
jgi:capsular polysaccharide biosynthesis protein